MKKKKELKTSNPFAKMLSTGLWFRPKVVKNKKKYDRKKQEDNYESN